MPKQKGRQRPATQQWRIPITVLSIRTAQTIDHPGDASRSNTIRSRYRGTTPRGMGVARLCDLLAEWSRQRQMLGLFVP
jgi:hypothetical protein